MQENKTKQVRAVLSYLLIQAGVKSTLYPYQLDGVARMLFQQSWTTTKEGRKANLEAEEDYGYFGKMYGLGMMQSDATGLGKTLQTLALCEICRYVAKLELDDKEMDDLPPGVKSDIKEATKEIHAYAMTRRLAADQPVLIICPLSVFVTWKEEIAKHTSVPSSRVLIYHGPSRASELKRLRRWPRKPYYVLTTCQTLVSDGGLRQAKAKRTIRSTKFFRQELVTFALQDRIAFATKGNRLVRTAPMRTPILKKMKEAGTLKTLFTTKMKERKGPKATSRQEMKAKIKADQRKHREEKRAKDLNDRRLATCLDDLAFVGAPLDPNDKDLWTTKGFWFRHPLAAVLMDEAPYTVTSSTWQALYALTRDPYLFRVVMTASPIANSVNDLAARLTLAGFSPFEWGSPSYLALLDPRPSKDEKIKDDKASPTIVVAAMVKRLREVAMICRPKSILGSLLPPLTTLGHSIVLSPLERHFYKDCLHNTAMAYRMFLQAPSLQARQSAWADTLLRLLRLRQVTTHPAATLGRAKLSVFCEAETKWLLWQSLDDETRATKAEPPRPHDRASALMRYESSKFRACAELIVLNQARGIKTLVISQWTAVMDLFEIYLFTCHQLRAPKFDGRLSLDERSVLLSTFRSADPKELPTMLLQLQTGGVGLTITGTAECPVSEVVFLDSWFNPTVEDQARDRVWRQSQTRPVRCHKLDGVWPLPETSLGGSKPLTDDDKPLWCGTIDMAIRNLQGTKRELAKVYIGHGDEVVEWEVEGSGGPGGPGGPGLSLKDAQTLLDAVMKQDTFRSGG